MRLMLNGIKSLIAQITGLWVPGRDRVLWAPVFLGMGIALYFALEAEPHAGMMAGLLVWAVLMAMAAHRKFTHFFYPALCLVFVLFGLNLGVWRTLMVDAPMVTRNMGPITVEGRIEAISVADANDGKKKQRVVLSDVVFEGRGEDETPDRVRLTSYHIPVTVQPGDRISVLARLMPPSPAMLPGGFDFRRQAFFEQLGAVGFTLGQFKMLEEAERETRVLFFSKLRQKISTRINEVLSPPSSGVAIALLTADRSNIPNKVMDNVRDSGLAHLLAISGLHLGIVCGFIFFVLRFLMALSPWLTLHWPIKKIAAVAAIFGGLFYMMLAGAPIPTQRAMFMTGLIFVAMLFDRSALSIRTIALAAFIVLLFRPETLVGASFQMSFAAVLALIAFYEGVGRNWILNVRDHHPLIKFGLYFIGIGLTTLIVTIGTIPVVLHHFGRLQLLAVLANAVAIPVTTFFVMPSGLLALMLMPFGLEGVFLTFMGWGIDLILRVSGDVASMPGAVWPIPNLPIMPYLMGVFGFLVLCFWRGWQRFFGAGIMVVAVIVGCFFMPRPIALIDAEVKSMAVHNNHKTLYLQKRPSSFVRKNWMSAFGGVEALSGKPLRDGAWKLDDMNVRCDDLACRIFSGRAKISLLAQVSAIREECAWADLIIAQDKGASYKTVEDCGAYVMSYWDIRRAQGGAIWPWGTGVKFVPVVDENDNRPWTLKYQKR